MGRIRFKILISIFMGVLLATSAVSVSAKESLYALNIYGGKLTSNHIEDFFTLKKGLDIMDSQLLSVGLARRIGSYRDLISYEIEGQLVKHFDMQDHWELNAFAAARWEKFWWDEVVDTSFAFGIGPSYATEKPEVEVLIEGDSQRWMVFLMVEFAFSLPEWPGFALTSRIHHRSEAFGIAADEGGANALALGVKYRF